MANKLIHLYLHHAYYVQLYNMKRNAVSETTHNPDDQMIMDINPEKIDMGSQTEFLTDNTMNQIGANTAMLYLR